MDRGIFRGEEDKKVPAKEVLFEGALDALTLDVAFNAADDFIHAHIAFY